jgi:WD40 repeat protein/tRNA A-37 threonylcarbamoyl transferase component Bud32
VDLGTIGQTRSKPAAPIAPQPSGRFPRFLGEYELLGEIARGGMGVVYRARQDKLNRLVAVKLIRSGSLTNADELRRFHQEAEAIADLDHPHIIPIYEIGQEDDEPYFSMKLVEGGSLSRHIPRLKNESGTAVALMAKVARAVHYAHQRTILHRDIKPSNILLDEQGEPYVTDFGLAKRIGPDSGTAATVTGAVMGTPAYMPPEQARGGTKTVTTAADVYSLGATLYEALTGQPPFAGDSAGEIMRQVLDLEPARPRLVNPKLDRDLETICLKCLAKEPARRYGSAEALAEDLERWSAGMPITARPVPMWERAVKWVKRRPELAALVVVVQLALLGLISGGIWFTLRLRQERDLANRGRYAADMNLARRALDDGLIYQVREQLATYRTEARPLGDLRSFEWYYLANLCDPATIRLRGHEQALVCLAFHPDGQRVVSGSTDGTVRIWDLTGLRTPRILEGRGGTVFCVAVSRDGRCLAAGDAAGQIRLWKLETGQERTLKKHEHQVRSLDFSRDSCHLLSIDAGGLIVQWDVVSGGVDFELRDRIEDNQSGHGTMAAYSPDGRTIVSGGGDEWVKIWDVAAREVRNRIRGASSQDSFSISPDGRHLAVAGEYAVEILNLERLDQPRRIVQRRGYTAKLGITAFSPDWQLLAQSNAGGEVRLLDSQSGRVLDLFVEQPNRSSSALGHLISQTHSA